MTKIPWAIPLCCISGIAQGAQEWHPAADPYRGSPTTAIDELIAAGAPERPTRQLAGMLARYLLGTPSSTDNCIERDLEEGELIDLMESGHGVLVDQIVPDPWPMGLNKFVVDCSDNLGNHLLYPWVCGNWSYQWILPTQFLPPFLIIPGYEQSGEWLPWLPGIGGGWGWYGPGEFTEISNPSGNEIASQPQNQTGAITSTPEPRMVWTFAGLLGLFLIWRKRWAFV